MQEYEKKQLESGRFGLIIKRSGLVISEDNPWLAASPGGIVTDPTAPQPVGLVEIKTDTRLDTML